MKRTDAVAAGKAFIERMNPVIIPIFTYLESGSQEAYKFIDGSGARGINRYLFSDIVRDHVCRKLDEHRSVSNVPFSRIYVANSGIRVYYGGITLKVLRPGIDEDGDAVLPAPKSDQQQLFYMDNYYIGGGDDIVIQSLVMLWQSDHGVRSTSAWLACPEEGRAMLFCEPIPHPATTMHAPLPQPAPEEDDDLYQRKDDEAAKENQANSQPQEAKPFPKPGEKEGEDE